MTPEERAKSVVEFLSVNSGHLPSRDIIEKYVAAAIRDAVDEAATLWAKRSQVIEETCHSQADRISELEAALREIVEMNQSPTAMSCARRALEGKTP